MDGFSYTNIFETKGIEYITIIFFFLILIPFWLLINRKVKQPAFLEKAKGFISASSLRIPQGVFFSKFHTWAHLEKNGEARVGLDDLLVHITGDIKFTQVKQPGEKIKKGELLARLSYNGKTLKILSPVSGNVQETNATISKNPAILKDDPYNLGWIYSIQPINWKEDTDSCYLAEDATKWAVSELERFKDFLAVSNAKLTPEPMGVVLQDGGEIVENPLSKFPKEIWDDFQKSFLS